MSLLRIPAANERQPAVSLEELACLQSKKGCRLDGIGIIVVNGTRE